VQQTTTKRRGRSTLFPQKPHAISILCLSVALFSLISCLSGCMGTITDPGYWADVWKSRSTEDEAKGSAWWINNALDSVADEDGYETQTLLLHIVQTQADAGMYDEALAIAQTIKGQGRKASAHWRIIAAELNAGMYTQALSKMHTLEVPEYDPQNVYRVTIYALCKANRFSEALAIAQKCKTGSSEKSVYADIALAQVKAGLLASALATTDKIAQPDIRLECRKAVMSAFAKDGNFTEALLIAQESENPENPASVLIDLAAIQAQAGMMDASGKTFQKIYDLLSETYQREMFSPDPWPILENTIKTQIAAGMLKEATASINKIQSVSLKANGLAIIAETLPKKVASKYFAESIAYAENLDKWWEKMPTLSNIAKAQSRVGMFDEALKTARKLQIIAFCASPTFIYIAEQQSKTGMTENAQKTYSELLQRTNNIIEHKSIKSTFKDIGTHQQQPQAPLKLGISCTNKQQVIAQTYLDVGISQAKAGLFPEALKTAEEFESPDDKLEILLAIALAQHSKGLQKNAEETFAQAITCAQKHEKPFSSMSAVTKAQIKAKMFDDALNNALKIENPKGSFTRSIAICNIAKSQIDAGQYVEALATTKKNEVIEDQIYILHLIAQQQIRGDLTENAASENQRRDMAIVAMNALPKLKKFRDDPSKTNFAYKIGEILALSATAEEIMNGLDQIKTESDYVQAYYCIGVARGLTR